MKARLTWLSLLAALSCHGGAAVPPVSSASGAPPTAVAAPAPVAAVGAPAPDFTLPDLDGRPMHLAELKGHPVVLEWFNPECPFVRLNHTHGPLKDMARRWTARGAVWLSINSAASGRQGYGVDANRSGKSAFSMVNPILLDEQGIVGRAYDARHTPTVILIDERGAVAYMGGVDNAPDGEPPGGQSYVNYLEDALTQLAAGRPIATREAPAYGCSVKYAK